MPNVVTNGAGIDLVVPLYNEEALLPPLFENLATQVDADGRPLPRGFFRVVAVNNASTDSSRDILARYAEDPSLPETVVLDEPAKGVVQARIRGSDFVLREQERRRFPYVVHTDADNLFPPTFFHDVLHRLESGPAEVLTYAGFRPAEFWLRVPDVARRQYEEVGTIHFDRETIRAFGFDESGALFTEQVYDDFEQVPMQCGLAMTKAAFARAGGYQREFRPDGEELLGEARNLLYRLDRTGARLGYVRAPHVVLNPRRLLIESEKLWAGRSYTHGMSDVREEPSERHYQGLNSLAAELDFEATCWNIVQRHVLDPCITRPSRLAKNRAYFGPACQEIGDEIERLHASGSLEMYSDVRPLSLALMERHFPTIVQSMREMRGLATRRR